jgi:hypothetical protein
MDLTTEIELFFLTDRKKIKKKKNNERVTPKF